MSSLVQGERISLDQQIQNHAMTVAKFAWYGPKKVRNLGKCLYTVNMGSNDYINNYFMPQHYTSSSIYSPAEYAEALIRQYAAQLKVNNYYLQDNLILVHSNGFQFIFC